MSDYSDFISAVKTYYNVDSTVGQVSISWRDMYDIFNQEGFTIQDYYNYMRDRPDIFTIQDTLSGARYNVNLKSNVNPNLTGNIGSNTNSNNVASILGGSKKLNIPSIVNKSTTGRLEVTGGIGLKSDTGLTATGIASTIGVAIGAVGIGAKLGKIIGDNLYNASPGVWDDGVISGLSNTDWNKFAISLKDDITGRVQNGILGLFGVDGDNTTMYLDENAVGYLTWYMSENNLLESHFIADKPTSNITLIKTFSSTETTTVIRPDQIKLSDNIYESSELIHESVITTGNVISTVNTVKDNNIPDTNFLKHFSGYARSKSTVNGVNTRNLVVLNNKELGTYTGSIGGNIIKSENPNYPIGKYDSVGGGAFDSYNVKLKEYDNTINVMSGLFGISNILSDLPIVDDIDENSMLYNELAKVNGLGTYIGTDGISNNTNSTQFDPTGIGSVATALEALKKQFPEMWDNAITRTIPQEDGSDDEHIFIPIPIPKFNNAFDTQPTTGTPDQKDPQVDPSTTPEEDQKNLADTVAPPTTPSDDTNTGNGDTPTIITPSQQASSLWAIYNPSLSELNNLGTWLWSTDFIDQLLKIFNDPMQAIIGLHKVYASPVISGSGSIKVGYLDSGVSSNIVGNQYTYIDCGSVSLREYYGNVLDYAPYTTVQLYLPFIGIVSLDVANVSRSTISVKYGVDVLTGACLASVSVQRDNAGGVLYQYSGNCACHYPLSSGSYMGMVTGMIGSIGSLACGNIFGTAMSVAGMHTNIEHSGGFSGNAGAMGAKKPYLIVSRPQSAMNDGFPSIQGYPSNYYTRLGNCSGFTQIAECHIENIPATDKELDKIKDLLKEGVIL